ncbi:hypothetical protein LNL84_08645 [Vibrio sp. ZSDZ34]|uniref:Uncharacterized protein n=1 Tax=Vibrio gelatinilyticus TaxID=2893468 RepID=A0A9X2AYS1_9VIBR|nr:hypothetical protein [Vibrio gelatinilyticus]MCJ2376903.1 hypothetical protein [Vibrio gelatinilyticus]
MHTTSLQLDAKAQDIVCDLLEGLEQENGWFKMTVRYAALIDAKLKQHQYIGRVVWFSDVDFIEKEIEYS